MIVGEDNKSVVIMAEAATLSETRQTPLNIEPLSVYLGAKVTGLDHRRPLEEGTIDTLLSAHAEHRILTFSDQNLTGDQLLAFGRQLGELTVHPFSTNNEETPELIVYDNKEGNPPPRTDIWHTDEMFREAPPMGSILSCKSPGRKPKLSPASTAGLVITILVTILFFKAATALATA